MVQVPRPVSAGTELELSHQFLGENAICGVGPREGRDQVTVLALTATILHLLLGCGWALLLEAALGIQSTMKT